jgi:uncharacterized protein YxjI
VRLPPLFNIPRRAPLPAELNIGYIFERISGFLNFGSMIMSVHEALKIVNAFSHNQYTLRRKVFTLLGKKFHIYDPAGQVVLFGKMKAFKLKEDLRLYTGEDMQTEIFAIKARSIIDFSSAYDVFDSENGQKIGALKRRGLKSMLRDEWVIMDAADRDLGIIREDSMGLALLRRFIDFAALLLPQKYVVEMGGRQVAEFKQNFNPFVQKLQLNFVPGTESVFDRRLGLAAAICLIAIEGRQNR